jgi:hypothetical protein
MRPHKLERRQRHPLVQRHVGKVRAQVASNRARTVAVNCRLLIHNRKRSCCRSVSCQLDFYARVLHLVAISEDARRCRDDPDEAQRLIEIAG